MDTDVLVVGAGPTELMLANQLVRRGIRTLIIDRSAPSIETRALGVQARTLEIYSQLGIVDRALELGKRDTGGNIWAEGQGRARVALSDAGEAATSSGESACLRFRLKQILPSPGVELLQNRPELSSERGQRVFNTHRHFGEHLSFDKSVPLKFSQLLRQYFLRDSRHALPEDFEPERLFGAHKPPENDWFPAAANQDEQFLDRTHADNTFSAHFTFGDQVSVWFLVSPS